MSFISCKKEKLTYISNNNNLIWESPDCHSNFGEPIYGGEQSLEDGEQFKFPVFNPNNQDEIIYYKTVSDSGTSNINESYVVRYNILSHSKNIILNGIKINSSIVWNKNGWIAFKNEQGFIMLSKDDGSMMQQFSNYPSNLSNDNLCWLNGSDTLLWRYNDMSGNDYLVQKIIGEANSTSLITSVFSNMNISDNSNVIYYANQQFKKLNLKDLTHNTIIPTSLSGNIYGNIESSHDNQNFYVSMLSGNLGDGLYKVNSANGNQTKLMSSCQIQMIKHFHISNDNKRLIFEMINRSVVFNGNSGGTITDAIIREKSSIWLMNINTSMITKISL